jgi:hypothetical protein
MSNSIFIKLEFLNFANIEEIEYGTDEYPANILEKVKLSKRHISIKIVLN